MSSLALPRVDYGERLRRLLGERLMRFAFGPVFGHAFRGTFEDEMGAAAPTLILHDAFTDTNGTLLSAHTIAPVRPGSAVWSLGATSNAPAGTSIQSNKFYGGQWNSVWYYADCSVANYTITALLLSTNNQGAPVFWHPGIIARYEASGYYAVLLSAKNDNLYIGEHVSPSYYYTRAQVSVALDYGVEYLVTVTVAGSLITASVLGYSTSYTMTTHLTSTNVGVYVSNPGCTVDDFKVYV